MFWIFFFSAMNCMELVFCEVKVENNGITVEKLLKYDGNTIEIYLAVLGEIGIAK